LRGGYSVVCPSGVRSKNKKSLRRKVGTSENLVLERKGVVTLGASGAKETAEERIGAAAVEEGGVGWRN